MVTGEIALRLRRAPTRLVLEREVAVARSPLLRTLGLALLDREQAGPGLLLPRCRSVHTFGMRFALDLYFLDGDGARSSTHLEVPPGRVVSDRRAASVLELPAGTALPAGRGEEFAVPRP